MRYSPRGAVNRGQTVFRNTFFEFWDESFTFYFVVLWDCREFCQCLSWSIWKKSYCFFDSVLLLPFLFLFSRCSLMVSVKQSSGLRLLLDKSLQKSQIRQLFLSQEKLFLNVILHIVPIACDRNLIQMIFSEESAVFIPELFWSDRSKQWDDFLRFQFFYLFQNLPILKLVCDRTHVTTKNRFIQIVNFCNLGVYWMKYERRNALFETLFRTLYRNIHELGF